MNLAAGLRAAFPEAQKVEYRISSTGLNKLNTWCQFLKVDCLISIFILSNVLGHLFNSISSQATLTDNDKQIHHSHYDDHDQLTMATKLYSNTKLLFKTLIVDSIG